MGFKHTAMAKKGKKKGKKKGGKKPGTASSTASSKSGGGKKGGEKGKKGKKKKKEIALEDIHFPPAPGEMTKLGLVEFYHGETPQEQFEKTSVFRSYKMPTEHRPPSPMSAYKNIRQMYGRRFPRLSLSRNLD